MNLYPGVLLTMLAGLGVGGPPFIPEGEVIGKLRPKKKRKAKQRAKNKLAAASRRNNR